MEFSKREIIFTSWTQMKNHLHILVIITLVYLSIVFILLHILNLMTPDVTKNMLYKDMFQQLTQMNFSFQQIIFIIAALLFIMGLDLGIIQICLNINKEDKQHFEEVCILLNDMDIKYNHNKKLVRGLDYYNRTTFEITSKVLGSQDAIGGGGRYDGLVEQLGGNSTPAVGFAAGVERLILAIDKQENSVNPPDIYLISLGEEAAVTASKLANDLRNSCGKIVLLETLRRSLKAQMREAGRCGAMKTIIIGEDELAQNKVIVKNMASGSQQEIPMADITRFFKNTP